MAKLGPLPAVPGVCKLRISGTIGNRPFVNIFHASYSTDFLGTGQCLTVATNFYNAYKGRFQTLVCNGVTVTTCDCQDLGSDVGQVATYASSWTGNHSGTMQPANVAMCLGWHIGRHYRGGHPRTYFPGTAVQDTQDPSTWSGATEAAWIAAGNGLISDVQAFTGGVEFPMALVCVHYIKKGVYQVPPPYDVLSSAHTDSRIDTQRRRLGKSR